jgi:transcriptional regulator with XRE-family HTH domain
VRKLDLDNEFQRIGYANLLALVTMLKEERLRQGLTQAQVAALSGISISTISKYERGIFPTRVVWLAAYFAFLDLRLTITFKDAS